MRRFLSLALALFLIVSSAPALISANKKVTEFQNRRNAVRGRIKEVKQKLAVTKHKQHVVTSQLYSTQRTLNSTRQDLGQTRSSLIRARADLRRISEQLKRAEARLLSSRTALTNRLTDAYKHPSPTYLAAIVTSQDAWSAMTRVKMVQQIVENDVRLVSQIRSLRQNIAERQVEQRATVARINTLQSRLGLKEAQEKRLATLQYAQLDEIRADRASYERALDELIAESNRIASRIQALQATPAGRARYAKAFKGGFIHPVNGRVSSGFGMRFHPILKKTKLHTGVDFACPSGTSVKAAASGTVIMAGWMGAYGNAVVIDHGGGVSTLYGHNSRVACRAGQEVKQGQVIAYSGSTGWSTGPHCHFEVRRNGVPVNPF
ncbi:MAG: peptidoglycan DD-metalloendopeptidase family protein [Armatimonadetes bacterium]|nr:peptidoglycan DD-metalloendopeptidase family protein [Armatimonadota bacterium]